MKKVLLLVLVLVFTLTLAFSLTACNKDKAPAEEDKTVITYLGDSICEALIGASPVSERDNYGYYAIVGRINEFRYYNHSVSGHKTSDGMLNNGYGLLELINKTEEDGVLIRSHIQEADMIHISILGNNALQFDMGQLMLDAAEEDYMDNYQYEAECIEDGITPPVKSLLYYMVNGWEDNLNQIPKRESLATKEEVYFAFPNTYQNICDIVSSLKALNPNAKIIFQKVYNPVYEGTTLLANEYWEEIDKVLGIDNLDIEDEEDSKIIWAKRRETAQRILNLLNGVLDTYAKNNPGQIEILDINSYFNDITGTDLTTNSVGAQLMYADWTHPSNKGHAAIAAYTQQWVESLGYASPNALANYKEIKVEQVDRMYKGQTGFNADAAIAAINAGTSLTEVSAAYFAATDAFTPYYSRENLNYNRTGETYYNKTTKFAIDTDEVIVAGTYLYKQIEELALNKNNCYAEFTSDGKLHFQIQTATGLFEDLTPLLALLDEGALDGLGEFDLNAAVRQYVAQLFPGFTIGDLEDALGLIESSMGVNIKGLDYSNQDVKNLLSTISSTGKLPNDIFDKIPKSTVLTLTMDVDYRIKTVKSVSGAEFTAIYLGKEVAVNPDTQPIGIFTQTEKDGKKYLVLSIDFIGLSLPLIEIV